MTDGLLKNPRAAATLRHRLKQAFQWPTSPGVRTARFSIPIRNLTEIRRLKTSKNRMCVRNSYKILHQICKTSLSPACIMKC